MRSDAELLVSNDEVDRLHSAAEAAMVLDPVTVLAVIHRLRLAEDRLDRVRAIVGAGS